MPKIRIGQFLEYTNRYVTIYIEDEFRRGEVGGKTPIELLSGILTEEQLKCPIDYIRNVDGGHFRDNEKSSHDIVLGIGYKNYNKYFLKEQRNGRSH